MDYQSRLKSLRHKMAEDNVDVAMITSPVNVYYFTGFYTDPHERFLALVIDNRGDQISLFVPELEERAAKDVVDTCTLISVPDGENPYTLLQQTIRPGVRAFGIEKKNVSLFQYEQLAERFPQAAFTDVEAWITSQRMIKTADEIARVQRAVDVIEDVLRRGIEAFSPGMTELELTAELEYHMKVLGAERPAFSTTVLSGQRSSLPHGTPGERKIERGDFLLIDMGVFVDGYCSDITRTFVVGEGTEKQTDMYDTVLKANREAIAAVKSGTPIGNADRAARDYIAARGYGPFFTHRVGHGFGLEAHEAPSLHSDNDLVVTPGLLLTIEPGIYIPEIGGVRIEDDVYVGADGQVQVLTSYPKELTFL
ncbi:M24 family metallopeptidase [Novibacillus thermophilus]|uniref:Peptidase M24 family protein n=1 Tax=Novibacillus thermophilus TaxID=1471761 RepID=A0A1U9K3P0_9BACL|nr:Xaa-Pro peptidase family protein [Novibacillus thermophilus]AQS54640.1 peptidase M24 family protein [Novibacillus thermophilus]